MATARGISCFRLGRRSMRVVFNGSIKKGLEMQKLIKYEGESVFLMFSARGQARRATRSTSPLSSRFASVKALLILGNQISFNMFTSYSHAPAFRPLPLA